MILASILLNLIIARGGGGGSGGGGGGGSGGSGGSGGGGGIIFLALVGFVPIYFIGSFFHKKKQTLVGSFITWPLAVIYGIVLIVIFKGFGVLMLIGALVGAAAGLYTSLGKLRQNKKAETALQGAAATDTAWDQSTLMTNAAQAFQRFQADWSKFDTQSMQQYLTPAYHYHVSLMMLALKQAARINQVTNVQIIQQTVQEVVDEADNAQDRVTIGFEATAHDQLIDSRDQKVLFTDNNQFVEYWKFQRSGNSWLLSGIDEATANYSSANVAVQKFAQSQNFCYSLDWGWLLLPRRGQLFGKGTFGTSDINNHVIGDYNDTLIQIYTYTQNPQTSATDRYLVAQMQLPKSYGDIVVRHKNGVMGKLFGIKGLDRIEMEWPDFNKKYEVFTSTSEGPTSFELLHPVFMETLEAAPFEVSLEVTDNIVYFYTKETNLQPNHYLAMLAILAEAFKQMKR